MRPSPAAAATRKFWRRSPPSMARRCWLLRPPHGFDLVAWIAPFAVLAAALAGTVLLIRRWAVSSIGAAQDAAAVEQANQDPEARALHEKFAGKRRRWRFLSHERNPSLVAGLLLALAVFCLHLLAGERVRQPARKTRLDYLFERKDQLYENLRDLNFEYRAGKYPERGFSSPAGAA